MDVDKDPVTLSEAPSISSGIRKFEPELTARTADGDDKVSVVYVLFIVTHFYYFYLTSPVLD